MIRQLTSKPICFTKICIHFWSAKHFVKYFLFFFGLVVYLLSACKWEDYCMIRQLTSKPICFTKICNHFWFAKHFVKYFYFLFGLVVYLLSACGWEDYCMIRQLTSKPICFTKICIHFWSAKHFVKYFLFFFCNPGGTRTHNRMDCGLNAACIPIPPPDHFYHYVKEPFSFVSQRYKSFLKPQNY